MGTGKHCSAADMAPPFERALLRCAVPAVRAIQARCVVSVIDPIAALGIRKAAVGVYLATGRGSQ